MHSDMATAHQQIESTHISGERRNDRRYDMQLEMRWKLIRRRRVLETGTGHTLDLSSGGLLLETGAQLTAGLDVELAIAWPVKLHNVAPMQLMVWGRVVRSTPKGGAIRMMQHEFRTAGTTGGQRPPQPQGGHAASLFRSTPGGKTN
jgi:hypothetical protein